MDTFLKAIGCVLAALIIYLVLAKQNMDFSLLLTVAVCAIVIVVALQYIEPVFNLVKQLQSIGKLDSQMVGILLKSAGVALVSEIVEHICQDAGNGSMGKAVHILTAGIILWLSIPMFTTLLELVEELLVAI